MGEVNLAKKLLAWKQARLNSSSDIQESEVSEFFAPEFKLYANERSYDATYENYLAFLKKFTENVKKLTHKVYEYLESNNAVIMPMRATLEFDDSTMKVYEAVMILKFNDTGKIIEWREVCYELNE